jgi:hypothetical protein
MNMTMKACGVLVSVLLAGSVALAEPYRGDYHGDRHSGHDRGGRSYHGYNGGRSYHGYNDGGRHYGYSRDSRGNLIFGLVGIGLAAAIVSTIERPTVYVQPAPVVYETPRVVYVQPQPRVVQQITVVEQPVQVAPPQPIIVTINIQNSNGSFTPVTLRQVGAQWVGPRGEYYNGVPSVGQLRPMYGF